MPPCWPARSRTAPVTGVGESGQALKDMAGMPACGKIAVTDQERGDVLALAGQTGRGPIRRHGKNSIGRGKP
jgi:hypothetical protein